MSENKFKFPTEVVELPSKGLPYPESSPLSSGKVEMKYMSAREEDILTNMNFIRQGVVIDKLLQSMIVSEIDYNELLIGDKNALLIASRILGYGKDYDFEIMDDYGQKIRTSVDLTSFNSKPVDESLFSKGKNEFALNLPISKVTITFKLLTHADEKKIDQEIKGLTKVNPNGSYDITTRLKHTITSVNGSKEQDDIRTFVDNMMVKDARFLREYIAKITPDLDLNFSYIDSKGGVVEGITLPMGTSFFWPDSGV